MSNTVKPKKPWLRLGPNTAELTRRRRWNKQMEELRERATTAPGRLKVSEMRNYLNWIRGV